MRILKYSYGITYEKYDKIKENHFNADTGEAFSERIINDENVNLKIRVKVETLPLSFSVSVENLGNESVKIKTVTAMSAEFCEFVTAENDDEIEFYTDWDHIWHNVGMTNSDENIWNLKRYHSIYNAGIVRRRDAKGVAVTFETPHNYGAAIEFENGKMTAFEYVDKELNAGETMSFDTFKISEYQHFGKALASLHRDKKSRKDIKNIRDYFGYNTWESYHSDIKPEDIYENLEVIKNTPLFRENIKYFIIDDGWEMNIGDWDESEKFSMGMATVAEKIKEAGLIPGIWSAPFLANGNSQLVKDHPDWILKNHEGQFISKSPKAPVYILDITHPEVKKFVADMYKKFYGWGYRYYKTDFLKEALLPLIHGNPEYVENLKRYDMSVTPEESMNEMNKIIRESLGEDSFWMGCGTQLTTNCDLMDATRVGGDICPLWARVPWQAAAVAWRLPINGHRALTDPDFTVISSHSTLEPDGIPDSYRTEKPYVFNAFAGPLFSENEVRTWLSFIIISGGLVNLSDRLAYLKPLVYELLEKVYKYAGGPGFLAIDAEKTLPTMYTRPFGDKTLLAVFNWSDEDSEVEIPFGGEILSAPETVKNIWTDEEIRVCGKPLKHKLNARSVLLCEF